MTYGCNCPLPQPALPDNYIKIFRGDDTDFNNSKFLKILLVTDIDLTGFKGIFNLLGFSYTGNVNETDKSLEIEIPASATSTFPIGPAQAVFRLEDTSNKLKTVSNTIPFYVTNQIFTDQPEEIILDVPPNYPISITLKVYDNGNGGDVNPPKPGGTSDYNELSNIPTFNGTPWKGDITFQGANIAPLSGLTALEDVVDEKASAVDVQNGLNGLQTQITTNKNDLDELGDQVHEIEAKIPGTATAENPLLTIKEVPVSTSTTAGIIRISNTAEVLTGMDPTSAVTPKTLQSKLNDYTNTTLNTAITGKANVDDVYTKTEVDEKISSLEPSGEQPDLSDYLKISDLKKIKHGFLYPTSSSPTGLDSISYSAIPQAATVPVRTNWNTLQAGTPSYDEDLTTKKYVDEKIAEASGGEVDLSGYLPTTGGTISGPLNITKGPLDASGVTSYFRQIMTKSGSNQREAAMFDFSSIKLGNEYVNLNLSGKKVYANGNEILTEQDKGKASGIAPLNASGKIDSQYLPEQTARLTTVSDEKYGIRADYALKHGIIDCPNGLIDFSINTKEITINPGIILQLAGADTQTTLASSQTYTVQETGKITLFLARTSSTQIGFLEAASVYYQEQEPTNGTDAYLAWYNPNVGKWQFKSDDTGNVWREAVATPFANINAGATGITSINYIGYSVNDGRNCASLSDIESLEEKLALLMSRVEALENK